MKESAHTRPGHRRRALLIALVLSLLGTSAVAAMGITRVSGSLRARAQSEPSAHAARVGVPRQVAPRQGASVEAIPSFSWRPVRGAAQYEFQLSADRAFRSVVGGRSSATMNTFATVRKSLADGSYFWRVRAIDSRDRAGRWSRARSLVKRWSTGPALLAPEDGAEVAYPKTPLVLRWEAVPYGFKYVVTIATDPSLAAPVIGTTSKPVETRGTVFALPGALAPGRYYWAVTPVDSRGHKGTQSRVGTFDWSWPTGTAVQVRDLSPGAGPNVRDPQFSWDPVPGAASYEVEVNSSEDFAVGSKVCCSDRTIGTSLSPTKLFANNTYYVRVRAVDPDDNAGTWNYPGGPKPGSPFTKGFDDEVPSIRNLRLRDNEQDPAVDIDPAPGATATSAPIVAWDAVAGASSYEVQAVQYVFGGCNWAALGSESWGVPNPIATASTAWTPLGGSGASPVPFTGGADHDPTKGLVDGHSYCVRVRARAGTDTQGKRVVSDWTQVAPAFTYKAPGTPVSNGPLYMPSGNYVLPAPGSEAARMPLFTWKAVAGACGYFVVVAKDADFTKVVDVARTVIPAYAPRLRTYADETTSYYWAVMPVDGSPCDDVFTSPQENSPRDFQKRSVAPSALEPTQGADVTAQPAFRWTAAEGAREYRLQVAQDPSFANLIDDVKTAATAYTSSSTYPADTQLYWRVRANDENGIGLNWSDTGSVPGIFRRRLPVPAVGPNPTGGEDFPVLSWASVPGAISYGMHVDWVDGRTSDFTVRSTAFAPVIFYGNGVWHWRVRANFPRLPTGVSSGGYTAPRAFTRFIEPPTGAGSTSRPRRLLVHWDPSAAADEYRIQFSESNGFTKLIHQITTENTSYAPTLGQRGFLDGGPVYWRVAAEDEGNNLGAWAVGQVKLPARMIVRVRGALRAGRRGPVTITVLNAKRRPIRGARVTPRGAGVVARRKRTNRRGRAGFRLRPRNRGVVSFRVDKGGFRPGLGRLRVR